MMKVCSNTSPIIFLSKIDQVELLAKCFSDIYIPIAVVNELKDQKIPDFLNKSSISEVGNAFVNGSVGALHQGELEAIVLARELKTDFVLLDDHLARKKAKRLGIKVIGTLGVLLLANKEQFITTEQTKGFIDSLIDNHCLYISNTIRDKIYTLLYSANSK